MKKIITSAVIAAIALLVISDAQAIGGRKKRQRSMSTPAPVTQVVERKTAQNIAEAAKSAAEEIDNSVAVMNPQTQKEALAELLDSIGETPDDAQLAKLKVHELTIEDKIKAKKAEIKLINSKLGWFDFGDEELAVAKGKLASLHIQLKTIRKKMNAQEKIVGPEKAQAIYYAVGTAVVLGGLVAIDEYFGFGITRAAGGKVMAGGKAVGGAVYGAGQRVGNVYRQYAPAMLGGTPTTP